MRKLIQILPYAFFASTTDEDKKSDFKLIPKFRQIFQNGGIFFAESCDRFIWRKFTQLEKHDKSRSRSFRQSFAATLVRGGFKQM